MAASEDPADERTRQLEGLAALAVTMAEMGKSPQEIVQAVGRLMGLLDMVTAVDVRAVAATIPALPQPLDESATVRESRRPNRNRFASWTGTAPLDASSGENNRHRLSRAGNRRMNRMLHIAATTQIRLDTEGRAYYRRKLGAGKSHMEAMRCLKRRISDAVYRQLTADAHAHLADSADPGGQRGATRNSSAADLPPHIGTSDQPLPGPASPTLRPAAAHRQERTFRAG